MELEQLPPSTHPRGGAPSPLGTLSSIPRDPCSRKRDGAWALNKVGASSAGSNSSGQPSPLLAGRRSRSSLLQSQVRRILAPRPLSSAQVLAAGVLPRPGASTWLSMPKSEGCVHGGRQGSNALSIGCRLDWGRATTNWVLVLLCLVVSPSPLLPGEAAGRSRQTPAKRPLARISGGMGVRLRMRPRSESFFFENPCAAVVAAVPPINNNAYIIMQTLTCISHTSTPHLEEARGRKERDSGARTRLAPHPTAPITHAGGTLFRAAPAPDDEPGELLASCPSASVRGVGGR